jgi:3-hydroxymyristoyl/3-hydroxydecanoyl-(acyl carrier protein) dehydratase
MDIHKVLSLLPHRYPFLLIDRVTEFEKDQRLVALRTSPTTSRSSTATSPSGR